MHRGREVERALGSTPERFRERLRDAEPVLAPGVYDGLSARLAAQEGFEAVYVSGTATAASRGMPDMSVLALTELVDAVGVVAAASGLSVIVDADTGFGGVPAVRRTVQELERAGAAAIQIEDQPFPRRCGYLNAEPCVPVEEMVRRVEAARASGSLVVVARTDALLITGFDDALARASAYLDAGADLAMINGITRPEEIERIGRELDGPTLYNVSGSDRAPMIRRAEARRHGIRTIIFPIQVARAATAAAGAALRGLASELLPPADRMTPFAEYMDLAGWSDVEAFERGLEKDLA
jgi:2-methylisocitrate lyase-like PEP mutase family enzyme